MRRLYAVLLPLAAPGGAALLLAQTPDSSRTFSSTHIDSTRIYFTQVVYQPPRVDTLIDTLWCSASGCSATRPEPALGVPFGPFALWSSYTTVKWGPTPFTASFGAIDPTGIVRQITAARALKLKLVLCMVGCNHPPLLVNGTFSLDKWKAGMAAFDTPTIKAAVAAGVADGTIIGNAVIDEPEHGSWGGVMTKPLLDQMAAYGHALFPTLPMGVNHTTLYATWQTGERYRVVDYVWAPPLWWNTIGQRSTVAAWRDKVRAQAALDGVAIMWGLNILDGGQKIAGCTGGTACCPLSTTGGLGTSAGPGGQNCRMTATQIRDWGKELGSAGCAMLMWRYDSVAVGRADNVQAMRDVAAALATAPMRKCVREAEQPVVSRGSG